MMRGAAWPAGVPGSPAAGAAEEVGKRTGWEGEGYRRISAICSTSMATVSSLRLEAV